MIGRHGNLGLMVLACFGLATLLSGGCDDEEWHRAKPLDSPEGRAMLAKMRRRTAPQDRVEARVRQICNRHNALWAEREAWAMAFAEDNHRLLLEIKVELDALREVLRTERSPRVVKGGEE